MTDERLEKARQRIAEFAELDEKAKREDWSKSPEMQKFFDENKRIRESMDAEFSEIFK